MKTPTVPCKLIIALGLVLVTLTGCKGTGGGSVGTGVYYGAGSYDPWYYGSYWHGGPGIIVLPPKPGRPPVPTHPIARPPPSAPRPTPLPSIPQTPRPSVRR